MGVAGLLKLLKPGASRYVDLRDGRGGRIIADGHYLLHKAIARQTCAKALVVDDDVKPLAKMVTQYITVFTSAHWDVTVVFDGVAPPGKRRTSTSRSDKRRAALERSRQEARLGDLVAAEASAKQSVSFSPRVVARVASILRHDTLAEIMTAPYEADGQLKVMENFYSATSAKCFVYGTDSDLVVLGVTSLLWQVSCPGGILGGQVIERDLILYTPESVLRLPDEDGGTFLRSLHGIEASGNPAQLPCLPPDVVVERLFAFSCIAGNDYVNFHGIGPKKAMQIAFDGRGRADSNDGGRDARMSELATAVVSSSSEVGTVVEVKQDISIALDMWEHPGVWFPSTGEHAHLSRIASSSILTVATGPLHNRDTAMKIAAGSIAPHTLLPWQPRISETPNGPPPSPRRASPHPSSCVWNPSGVSGYLRRATGEEEAATLSNVSSFFPREGENLQNWNKPRLIRFLNLFRCLEYSGVSTATKEELVALAESCVRIVRASKPGSAGHLFRMPADRTTPSQTTRAVMPDLPTSGEWLSGDPETLRPMLPKVELSVILEWLVSSDLHDEPLGRVITRGLQRAMDNGGLEGLSIVPATGSSSSVWLRLRVSASMQRNTRYYTYVLLAVHKLGAEEVDEEVATQHDGVDVSDESRSREQLIATTVQNANCECAAGVSGGCHHVCMLLQLVRLLQMSSRELLCHNPLTPTGRACKWILDHCRGGRGKEDNGWFFKPLSEVVDDLRNTRDPKRQCLGLGQHKAGSTRGVATTNRARDFDPHPQGGRWAESSKHFHGGRSLHVAQSALFEKAYDKQEKESTGERGGATSDALATRVNAARVRHDSDEDG